MESKKPMNEIERKLAEAMARKAVRDATEGKSGVRIALTPEEREATRLTRDAERVDRLNAKAAAKAAESKAKEAAAAERARLKEARKAEKAAAAADRVPAHMKKVERIRARLPKLSEEAQVVFSDATCNLPMAMVEALAQHLLLHVRSTKTMSSIRSKDRLAVGTTARITGGDPKYIGMVGEVVHSHKLRVKIQVPNLAKVVYVYSSEVEPVSTESKAVNA